MTILVVSSETSGCDLPFLVSKNWCRDLNSMSRPHSLCLYCISVSRPRLDVVTSFLLSSSLLLGHRFSFMLQHPSVVLSFQAGCDLKLMVFLFSCRNVDIRSRPSIFFNHCNSCRDLRSMSRPDCSALFWNICCDLELMSRHQFLLPVMLIFVATMFF